MNLDTVQTTYLRNVTTASEAYKRSKRDALARAKAIAAEEVNAYLDALDLEVRIAFDAGIPKSRIGRDGMGTSDSKTVDDSLSRTARAIDVLNASRDEIAPRFQWTGTTNELGFPEFLVSMHGSDWDEWLTQMRSKKRLRRPDLAGLTTATFFLRDDYTPGTLEINSHANWMVDHPVVAFHRHQDFAEMKAWLEANGPER